MIGTFWKNRIDSNTTENTIPAVVAIEMPAASHKAPVTQRSTVLRARKSLRTCRSAAETQKIASATPATRRAIRLKVSSVP